MHIETAKRLVCPTCRAPLRADPLVTRADGLLRGVLLCETCRVASPVLHGFPIFGEQLLGGGDPEAELEALDTRLFGDRAEVAAFLRAKRLRPAVDLYAAFRPFNESTRALDPAIALLRETLRPGDVLLDLWCRTGWTGELLAATFPEQRVLSVWENGSDVLGTRGFRYWLGEGRRLPNWDLIFHSPNDPLPFSDDAFAAIHGLDTLHRYRHRPLIRECLRVCVDEGVLIFPHIHLTNAEPDPFFERGETQLHGTRWRAHFEEILPETRRVCVLSEKRLFEDESVDLEDDADTEHYNACLVVVPAEHAGRVMRREPSVVDSATRAIPNPLLSLDPSSGQTELESRHPDSGAAALMRRHPMYEARLREHHPARLSLLDRQILYQARRHRAAGEIARRLGRPLADVAERLSALERQELVRLGSVSFAMAQLQQYYAEQWVRPPESEMTLGHLLRAAAEAFPDEPLLVWSDDGSVFSYGDAYEIARRVATFLSEEGVGRGGRVLIQATSHPEHFFAFWGAVLIGAIAISFDASASAERKQSVLECSRPDLAILRDPLEGVNCKTYWMTGEDEPTGPSLLEAVVDRPIADDLPALAPDEPAAVLFTSGSTGVPKGVVLSHGGLFRSSERIDRVHRWSGSDRFFGTGTPHTMSGLRNSVITPLHSGSSVVLGGIEAGPLGVLQTCIERGATLLNTTPAFLAFCVRLGEARIRAMGDHRLRAVLCTGFSLPPGLREEFESVMGCPVLDYYGLTETSGACLFVPEGAGPEAGIGRPVDCLAIIRDESGAEADEGELLLYTEDLALGYLTAEGIRPNENVRDGLLHTGDQVRRAENGCLVLLGRRDRMHVDRNGENVFPDEIERAIQRAEGVVACHVTTYREGALEALAALVVREPGTEDPEGGRLRAVLSASLPAAHVPSLLIEITEIPVGSAGKWDPSRVQEIVALQRAQRKE